MLVEAPGFMQEMWRFYAFQDEGRAEIVRTVRRLGKLFEPLSVVQHARSNNIGSPIDPDDLMIGQINMNTRMSQATPVTASGCNNRE